MSAIACARAVIPWSASWWQKECRSSWHWLDVDSTRERHQGRFWLEYLFARWIQALLMNLCVEPQLVMSDVEIVFVVNQV